LISNTFWLLLALKHSFFPGVCLSFLLGGFQELSLSLERAFCVSPSPHRSRMWTNQNKTIILSRVATCERRVHKIRKLSKVWFRKKSFFPIKRWSSNQELLCQPPCRHHRGQLVVFWRSTTQGRWWWRCPSWNNCCLA